VSLKDKYTQQVAAAIATSADSIAITLLQSNWLCCRDENELIQNYFWKGFQYQSIVRFLQEYHGINMSVRTLCGETSDWLADSGLHLYSLYGTAYTWNFVVQVSWLPGKLTLLS